MKNKKADISREEALNWILFLSIAIVLVAATVFFALSLKKASDIEKCKLSVATRGKAKILGKPLLANLQCYTRYVTIEKDGTYLNNKLLRKFNGDLEEGIKSAVADEMFTCWSQFLEGAYNPFDVDNTHCVICSEIKFSDEVEGKVPEVKDFVKYLYETKIPTTDKSYGKYFFDTEEAPTDIDERILTNQKYNVVFGVYYTEERKEFKSYFDGLFVTLGSGAAGCVGGAAIGVFGLGVAAIPGCVAGAVIGVSAPASIASFTKTEEEKHPFLLFIESNLVKNECDSLY